MSSILLHFIPILPAEALGTFPCKPKIFKNRARKAIVNGVK